MARIAVPPRARRVIGVVASVLWMALIFRLSALPGSAVPGRFGALGHFAMYAVLGATYLLAIDPALRSPRAGALAVVLASAYGITDEYHQRFVTGRMSDPVDWLVDTAGALAAVLIVGWVVRRLRSTAAGTADAADGGADGARRSG